MPSPNDTAPGTHPASPDDATPRIIDALRRVVRALTASARHIPRGGHLSGAQVFVLRQIAAAPGLSLGELATRTLARQSTVSEVVAKLVVNGLVTRGSSATDARQATLQLTPSGRRAIARLEPTAQEHLLEGLGALTTDQRHDLARGLEAWLDAAGLADVPPTMFLEPSRAPRHRRAGRPRAKPKPNRDR